MSLTALFLELSVWGPESSSTSVVAAVMDTLRGTELALNRRACIKMVESTTSKDGLGK
jgi:hypothetical protein